MSVTTSFPLVDVSHYNSAFKKYTSSFNMNLLSQVHSEEPELALCKATGATAMEECK